MGATLPIFAGMVSTAIFAASVLPMLLKAARTRELSSYSLGNIALANVGNAVHSVYVVHLPPGPIWILHMFYVVSSALMLYWCLRYRPSTAAADPGREPTVPLAAGHWLRERFGDEYDGYRARVPRYLSPLPGGRDTD